MSTFISPSLNHFTNTILIKVTTELHLAKSSGQSSGFTLFDLLLALDTHSSLKYFSSFDFHHGLPDFPLTSLAALSHTSLLCPPLLPNLQDSILDCFFTP